MGPILMRHRKDVIIATKFGNAMEGQGSGASAPYIRKAVDASLKRLGVDVIDLYQLHTPDDKVPIAETLGALNDLVKEGKIREIGSSNFSVQQISDAAAAVKPGAAHFISVQNEYSLMRREAEADVLPECERTGLAFLPYFPLASGMLTGKYRKGQPVPEGTRISTGPNYAKWITDANLSTVEALIQFAEARGHTILELAFAWMLRWKCVPSVIAGATKAAQVRATASSAGWRLTDAEINEVKAIASQPDPSRP